MQAEIIRFADFKPKPRPQRFDLKLRKETEPTQILIGAFAKEIERTDFDARIDLAEAGKLSRDEIIELKHTEGMTRTQWDRFAKAVAARDAPEYVDLDRDHYMSGLSDETIRNTRVLTPDEAAKLTQFAKGGEPNALKPYRPRRSDPEAFRVVELPSDCNNYD